MRRRLALVGALALTLGACGRSTEVNVNVDTTATAPVDTSGTSSQTSPDDPSAWAVSPDGLGPIRVGMSEAEAVRLLGPDAAIDAPSEGSTCHYAHWGASRPGIGYMLNEGRVARVDVDPAVQAPPGQPVAASALPRTADGIGVGATEAEVRRVYGSRLTAIPHKYVEGGSYFWLPVSDSTTQGLVLETDGRVVTTMRAGRQPEVGWVEGCS